ncbi:hypothetical protein MPSEU_000467800 [Mayamaea pseudoterrestris]|nr:hypothetical protein MPSEU_000467800 [Mayamaea pseudoterrestris]
MRRPFNCARQNTEARRCGPGKLLTFCVVFAFFVEMFISFTQPLPTIKVDFQKGPSIQFRGLSDNYETYMTVAVHPRVVQLQEQSSDEIVIHDINQTRPTSIYLSVTPISTSDCPYCNQEMNSHIFPFERPYYDGCTFMADWQATFHETCNNLHEFDLASEQIHLLSTQGSWRTVWKTDMPQDKSAILKLLKMDRRNFTHEAYAYHRNDANVMSQLTASPYVVNAYSFCGQSVLTEYASSGARNFVKDRRFSSMERLEMGRDLARALSALHSIDYSHAKNATLAHNDINMANAVQVEGQLKLNDFNIAVIMKWNKTKPCDSPVRFEAPLWKSPEEVRNVSYIDASLADVYGLGNLLFQVMSKHQPWTHLEPGGQLDKEQVVDRKLNGLVPFVPDKHKYSNKTAIQALYFGTMACFRHDPNKRLTSYELSRAFDLVLKAIHRKLKVPRETVQSFFEKSFWNDATNVRRTDKAR